MKCKCGSERIMSVSAKCSDLFSASVQGASHQGYVPHDINIGGGDYVEFEYCLDCGQIQGDGFPVKQGDVFAYEE